MPSVLVTGTSSGIGRACVRLLETSGWTVFASVRRADDAEALTAEGSDRLHPLVFDVTEPSGVRKAAAEVTATVGVAGLDALVNNAGIVVPGPLEFVEPVALRRQLDVNVTAQVAVTQAFLPLLRRGTPGRIVMMGSIGGRSVLPFAGAYCASKFALEAVTDALRMELRSSGIAVSLIEPGGVATPIWDKGVGVNVPEEAAERYGPALAAMKAAVGRVSTDGIPPEVVARTVLRVLTARRPRTRYLVGRMAYVRLALQQLPDRWRDALLLQMFSGS